MTDPYQPGAHPQPYLADSAGVPVPPPPPRTVAEGGGYPCDPSQGDLAVAGVGPVRAAGMGARLLARIIDWLIIIVFAALCVGAIVGLALVARDPYTGANAFETESDPPWWFLLAFLLMLAIISLVPLAYEIFMISKYGATLGKMAVGVRVIRLADGALPGAAGSFMRILIPTCAGLVCGCGTLLVYVSPFFDRSPARQGWHDMVAKTMVIRTR